MVLDGFEFGFDDATGAILQPIVVNGGHCERPLFMGNVAARASHRLGLFTFVSDEAGCRGWSKRSLGFPERSLNINRTAAKTSEQQ